MVLKKPITNTLLHTSQNKKQQSKKVKKAILTINLRYLDRF
ncbi:MAG: hypothetical protein ACI902_002415 [Psychroserpens sp.]|jgi:hypothetical protein